MMDKKADKGLSSSSLLDLKAELLRKKEEFQREKLSGVTNKQRCANKEKKPNIWSQSNAGVRERAQKDYEAKKEEDEILEKSRKVLEIKAKAYEKMISGGILQDENTNQRFLVDFERKVIDKLIEEKHQRELESDQRSAVNNQEEEQNERISKKEELSEPVNSDEEWIDYVDSLGRSRRCMKKDLPELKKMDRELTGKKTLAERADKQNVSMPELMSDDMYREKLRQQWEEEERRNMEQTESHYANVQFNEVRDHGVAYYQFDKDAEVRKQQMENLAALREKTKQNREVQQKLKKKRKAMMAARLAKVRQRKLIREGKDPNEVLNLPESSEESEEDLSSSDEKPKEEKKTIERDDSWRKTAPQREWDKGKEDLESFLTGGPTVYSEESWKEKLRQERLDEFAPPSIYKDTKPSHAKQRPAPEKKLFFTASKKLKAENDQVSASEYKQPFVGEDKLPKSTAVNVEEMVSKIRAEVEGSHKADNSTPAVISAAPGQGTDLADIPLPPTTCTGAEQKAANLPFPASDPEQAAGSVNSTCTFAAEGTNNYASQWWSSSTGPPYAGVVIPVAGHMPNTYAEAPCLQPAGQPTTLETSAVTYASQMEAAQSSTSAAPAVAGPQPAHYSSGPMKPQPPKRRYERVNLHELPLELPMPPTASNTPAYPSQTEVFGGHSKSSVAPSRSTSTAKDEPVKLWKSQFDLKGKQKLNNLKPDNIPFASSYIQSDMVNKPEVDPAVQFDPSVPPPDLS